MILDKILTPFKDTIFDNETKQIDYVNFNYFFIIFDGFLEYSNVSI
jgi:hypothetical protein